MPEEESKSAKTEPAVKTFADLVEDAYAEHFNMLFSNFVCELAGADGMVAEAEEVSRFYRGVLLLARAKGLALDLRF